MDNTALHNDANLLHLHDRADFQEIFGQLTTWRLDDYYSYLESGKRKGRVLPFARGLRFSARLIYIIRDKLSDPNLYASWGQVISKDEKRLSSECDIIIHRRGVDRKWNGNKNPVMDYSFVEQDDARIIISCKSYIRKNDVEKEYAEEVLPYVPRLWLFAECCGPRSAGSINTTAKSYGYEHFWYLYNYSKKTTPNPNYEGWDHFIETISSLRS